MEKSKILVVDDEPHVLSLLKDILNEQGYSVETVPNGRNALEKLTAGGFNLVISDVRMPGMDGIELLQQVKKGFEGVKVIMMTGYTDDYDISDVLILGADDYITKPFDLSRIIMSVSNLMRDQARVRPAE